MDGIGSENVPVHLTQREISRAALSNSGGDAEIDLQRTRGIQDLEKYEVRGR